MPAPTAKAAPDADRHLPALIDELPAALGARLERELPRLYATALTLTRHRTADAEDLTQQTLLNALRRAETFRDEAQLSTWLHTIAVRTWIRMRRRRAGQPAHNVPMEALLSASGPVGDPRGTRFDPQAQTLRHEAVELVQERLAALPDAFRVPLVLKDIAELPVADIARLLRLKPDTVKTRAHRARLLLRHALESRLPRTKSSAAYPPHTQLCLDLLAAKQAAIDAGQPFSADQVTCERCKAVFASLDLTARACLELRHGVMPRRLRELIASARGAPRRRATTRARA